MISRDYMQECRLKPRFILSYLSAFILAICIFVATPQCVYAQETVEGVNEAKAYFLMDREGHVLARKNPLEQMDMASITKIMTAMVALDSTPDLSTEFKVDTVDLGFDAQAAGFSGPQTLTLKQLMAVMLVYSANDAASLIARGCAHGDEKEFVRQMNIKAGALGLKHTQFKNPHGLEEKGHFSCARDLAVMGRYARDHYPFIREYVHHKSCTIPVNGVMRTYYSTDELLGRYQGILGMKTGKVGAGCTFLGAAERHGITLYSCVLGCPSDQGRFDDSATLLDYGFSQFEGRDLANLKLIFGWGKDLNNFAVKYPLQFAWQPKGYVLKGRNSLKANFNVKNPTYVTEGMPVGYATWTQDKRVVAQVPIVAGKPQVNPVDCGFGIYY